MGQYVQAKLRLIHCYIFRSMVPPFLLASGVLLFVLLMPRLLVIMNMIVSRSVSAWIALRALAYLLPELLVVVIPTAVLVAVFLVFRDMTARNEIVALRSAGVCAVACVPPVLVFASLAVVVSGMVSINGVSWGTSSLRTLITELKESGVARALVERRWSRDMSGLFVRAEEVSGAGNVLERVLVVDERDPGKGTVMLARREEVLKDDGGATWTLRLTDGTVSRIGADRGEPEAVYFESLEFPLGGMSRRSVGATAARLPDEMTFSELSARVRGRESTDRHYDRVRLELHRRLALPFASVAIALAAVPIGIGSRAGGKGYGTASALGIFLLYYLLHSLGWRLGKTGVCHPGLGMWAPNLVVAAIGVWLLTRMVSGER